MKILFDNTKIYLETERLIIRPFLETDLNDFYEYAKNPKVGPMAGWAPHKNKAETLKILKMFISGRNVFAVFHKKDSKVIGSIGLHDIPSAIYLHDSPLKGREIGYVLSYEYWGQGLIVEAVRVVMFYCFENLNFDFFTVGHFDFNNQSKRVIEKLGFKYLTTFIYTTAIGKKEFTFEYEIFKENFNK